MFHFYLRWAHDSQKSIYLRFLKFFRYWYLRLSKRSIGGALHILCFIASLLTSSSEENIMGLLISTAVLPHLLPYVRRTHTCRQNLCSMKDNLTTAFFPLKKNPFIRHFSHFSYQSCFNFLASKLVFFEFPISLLILFVSLLVLPSNFLHYSRSFLFGLFHFLIFVFLSPSFYVNLFSYLLQTDWLTLPLLCLSFVMCLSFTLSF